MRCYISDFEVPSRIVGPPAMNYGQHGRWTGSKKHDYRYELTISEFVELANSWFERCRLDFEADKDSDPPGTFPELEEFGALGFPSLIEMINIHPNALGRLMCWLEMDLNNLFTGTDFRQNAYYSANSVDWFKVGGSSISFGGVAYEIRRAP